MRFGKLENPEGRNRWLVRGTRYGLALAIGFVAMGGGRVHGTPTHPVDDTMPSRMVIQVNDDRLTVTVARAPQIYLYGVIDADAPQRFEALVRSGKIPPGSDIYLNASQGSPGAGMALGRLFRTGTMTTHLGTPRHKGHAGYRGKKSAVCTGACAYAYFGGLYRFAPTGSDRIGLVYPAAQAGAGEANAYLKTMGIDLARLGPAPASPGDAPLWLTADRMISSGLANNGRLPLKTKIWLLPPMPSLELVQDDRYGSHRLVLQCKPGSVTLAAYDMVGATRANQIVANARRSYVEVDGKEVLTRQSDGASAANGAVVITRPYPPTELVHLLSARTIGLWVAGRTSAFRYGYTFVLYPAGKDILDFYHACWRAAPWPLDTAPAKR
ncbi:hypothetical protein ACPPVV_09165 [Rhodanobacter sp. Col0626]|uniref:hypothetical protein n=1 Tax=Rhodanobacter sp. Col0626 TaxID=3415679 RepID=UPI003CF47E03